MKVVFGFVFDLTEQENHRHVRKAFRKLFAGGILPPHPITTTIESLVDYPGPHRDPFPGTESPCVFVVIDSETRTSTPLLWNGVYRGYEEAVRWTQYHDHPPVARETICVMSPVADNSWAIMSALALLRGELIALPQAPAAERNEAADRDAYLLRQLAQPAPAPARRANRVVFDVEAQPPPWPQPGNGINFAAIFAEPKKARPKLAMNKHYSKPLPLPE